MSLIKNSDRRITKKSEDFSAWYHDVIAAGGLARPSVTTGCLIYDPPATALWEAIRDQFNQAIKRTGHQNVMYPTLIPLSFFNREADHIQGFAPELAKIEKLYGKNLEDPLVLRPTSEVLIYDDWSRQIETHNDLPILINQWGNVFRVERKTRPFLRTFEFYWQEGHTAHASEREARDETQKMLSEYKHFIETVLAVPVIAGRKTEAEKFAGAKETYCIEAMMGDGKALQAATSHYFGTGFSSSFDISFKDASGVKQPVHTTSWGMSSRVIGALIMVHGDDKGIVLPPRLAPVQLVILSIKDGKASELTQFEADLNSLRNSLERAGIRVEIDERADRLGEKHYRHEKAGTPIRLIYGAKEAASNELQVVRRDTGEKLNIAKEHVEDRIIALLDQIQADMYNRALEFRDNNWVSAETTNELFSAFRKGNQFVSAGWSGDLAHEEKLKSEYLVTIRCIPFAPRHENKNCILTGLPAKQQVVIAKAY